MASVDIVVPCYNYARYLRDSVKSALDQPGVSVRVLIIDDHSSDDSAEVASSLAAADPRVKFRRHEVNQGHIATYNEGLREATADYVVLLSADDLLTPGALRRATDLMELHPSIGFVYGAPISLYGDALPTPRTQSSGHTIWKGRDWIERMCKAGRNFINCPEIVMRTSVQHAIGPYRSDLPHSADMAMWLRAATIADVGRVNGVDQAYYRVHRLSMQRTTYSGFRRDLEGRREAFVHALRDAAPLVDDAARLLDVAHHALAIDAVRIARRAWHSGDETADSIEAYRAFARELDPDVVTSPAWRAFDRSRRRSDGPWSTLRQLGIRRFERLGQYLAWRRWWRTGVY